MTTWWEMLLGQSDRAWPWFADSVLRSTIWLLAAWAADGALRRGRFSASLRHVLSVVTAIGIPFIFVATLVVDVPAGVAWEPMATLREAWDSVRVEIEEGRSPAEAAGAAMAGTGAGAVSRSSEVSRFSAILPSILVILWGVGVVAGVFRFAVGGRGRRRGPEAPMGLAGESGRENEGGQLYAVLLEESKRAGLRRAPRLCVGGGEVPMLRGLWTPVLLLPEAARNWPPEMARLIVRHELAHLRRGDIGWALAMTLVLLPLWFHPLAWHLRRRTGALREQACDDAVLRGGASPINYAEALVSLLPRSETGRPHPLALSVHDHPDPGLRLQALLDPSVSRRDVSLRWAGVLAGIALVVLCPITLLVGCAHRAPALVPLEQSFSEPPLPVDPAFRAPRPGDDRLSVKLTVVEFTLPSARTGELPTFAAAVEGKARVLPPNDGWQLFHVRRRGVDLLSAPVLITRPGQDGTIEVGTEFIHPATWRKDPVNGVDVPETFQITHTGIHIGVNVRATDDPERIRVEIAPRIREFAAMKEVPGHPGREEPVFVTRETRFRGEIENGSYIVIGHRSDEQQYEDRVPVLGSIPVLGRLFRSSTTESLVRLAAVRVVVSGPEATDGGK